MPSEIQVGSATVYGVTSNGTPITLTGYASFALESLKASHNFDITDLKDGNNFDITAIATNAHIETDVSFVPTQTSRTLAAAELVFPTPLSKVTLANFKVGLFNGDWQYRGGAAIDLAQAAVAKISSLKIRKYSDSAQNASLTTTVSG